jgi:hypothetical protein
MGDAPAPRFLVQRVDGTWYIGWPDRGQLIENRDWLEQWLAGHGASTADLDFGAEPHAERQFVDEFGPLTRHD